MARSFTRSELERIDAYIDLHLAESFELGDLAASMGLNPSYFNRRFKASTGTTPCGYVNRRRVEAAKRIIQAQRPDARAPLSDIAMRVGFYDQAHFTRQFRRFTGMTPRQFCLLESTAETAKGA